MSVYFVFATFVSQDVCWNVCFVYLVFANRVLRILVLELLRCRVCFNDYCVVRFVFAKLRCTMCVACLHMSCCECCGCVSVCKLCVCAHLVLHVLCLQYCFANFISAHVVLQLMCCGRLCC